MEEFSVYSEEAAETTGAHTSEQQYDQASSVYIGRWNRLISTTNWEKGRIITEWRQALIDTEASPREYSDEAWARRVGAVTGQHVGRLRRVYERFGASCTEYDGLYWSHFHAALDWDDAELWLEGAARSDWSVSQMRNQRWEAMGAVEADRPRPSEVIHADIDEDVDTSPADSAVQRLSDNVSDVQPGPRPEGPDFGDEDQSSSQLGEPGTAAYADDHPAETVQYVQPFEHLTELPEDLAEAFESLKLAVLRHKAAGWEEISCADVLAALDALKELAVAPAAD
jgi:hypothetical protein